MEVDINLWKKVGRRLFVQVMVELGFGTHEAKQIGDLLRDNGYTFNVSHLCDVITQLVEHKYGDNNRPTFECPDDCPSLGASPCETCIFEVQHGQTAVDADAPVLPKGV